MPDGYKHAERLLYSYPVNILRLHSAILELRQLRAETDCHAQSYEQTFSSEGQHSAPVEHYAERVAALEQRIRSLIADTDPVSVVRCDLKNSDNELSRELFCIMELYYFEHGSIEDVAFHLQRSVSTVQRRRQDLVGLVCFEARHPEQTQ